MIDLHLHLLPAVDDGAASLDVSRAMLAKAESIGFASLVATPHLNGPLGSGYEHKVRSALRDVKSAVNGSPISIELGYEILLSPDLPRRLQSGERIRLADSTTVLVELPFVGWPLYTEQTLFDIQTVGFRPLLAHPERYATLQAEPEKALGLAQRGIMMQVTIGSVVGLFGKPAQRIAELLLREGAATVLATDAHSAGQRFMAVEDGLSRVKELVGTARAHQLVSDNPKALLESRSLPSPAAIVISESGERGWRKLFQRGSSRARV
jgi:protein-tyrosine phosphatase